MFSDLIYQESPLFNFLFEDNKSSYNLDFLNSFILLLFLVYQNLLIYSNWFIKIKWCIKNYIYPWSTDFWKLHGHWVALFIILLTPSLSILLPTELDTNKTETHRKAENSRTPQLSKEDIMAKLIDQVLLQFDLNKDGYVEYPEFKKGSFNFLTSVWFFFFS